MSSAPKDPMVLAVDLERLEQSIAREFRKSVAGECVGCALAHVRDAVMDRSNSAERGAVSYRVAVRFDCAATRCPFTKTAEGPLLSVGSHSIVGEILVDAYMMVSAPRSVITTFDTKRIVMAVTQALDISINVTAAIKVLPMVLRGKTDSMMIVDDDGACSSVSWDGLPSSLPVY